MLGIRDVDLRTRETEDAYLGGIWKGGKGDVVKAMW